MKNQYFGDINDYKKYSLLRHLGGNGQLGIAVCWALTEADGKSDGKRIEYLRQPDVWRKYDSQVYDHLRHHVIEGGVRDVSRIRQPELVPNCRYYTQVIPDDLHSRAQYFEKFFKRAQGADLVFFDPDNGLEVNSIPRGKKQSSKYIYWDELETSYRLGHSILLYQHFPRRERTSFIRGLVRRFRTLDGIPCVVSYCTSHVAFLLLPQPHHEGIFARGSRVISRRWDPLIRIEEHR